MSVFQPTLLQFLEELTRNNNRPWFQENKARRTAIPRIIP